MENMGSCSVATHHSPIGQAPFTPFGDVSDARSPNVRFFCGQVESMEWAYRQAEDLSNMCTKGCGHSTCFERTREEVSCLPPPSPSINLMHDFVSEMNQSNEKKWSRCYLLSLPKEIRKLIWRHVLMDQSGAITIVRIDRKPFQPSYRLTRAPIPELRLVYTGSQYHTPLSLLLTRHSIYEEALPILYQSVSFMPSDLQGLLPIFYKTLSSFAQTCIRHIDLTAPVQRRNAGQVTDRSNSYFHWAVTCAQIAQLNDTLHQVNIEASWPDFADASYRRAILYPLRKIKAAKYFIPIASHFVDGVDYNASFQELLQRAEEELRALAAMRARRTNADARERAERRRRWKEGTEGEQDKGEGVDQLNPSSHLAHGPQYKKPIDESFNTATSDGRTSDFASSVALDEWEMILQWTQERFEDVQKIPGSQQFEKELKEQTKDQSSDEDDESCLDSEEGTEWDLVSMASGAETPTLRAGSVSSRYTVDDWVDNASTIVADDISVKKGEAISV